MFLKYLSFCFLLLPFSAFAQHTQKDFQVWQNAEIEYNLNKRWLLHVQQQSRFTENASQFSYCYFDIGGLYRITRNIRLSADYILVQKKQREGNFSTRHQYNIYVTARKKIGNFVVFYRVLHEAQLKDYNRSDGGNQLRDFFVRNKLNVRYKINKKLTPYVSDEVYYQLDGRSYEKGFNRNRIFAGILYNISDLWQVDGHYMVELNRNSKIPGNDYVIGLGVTRNFFQ